METRYNVQLFILNLLNDSYTVWEYIGLLIE
jgi:hypothetical protein